MRLLKIGFLVLALAVAALAFVAYRAYETAHAPYKAFDDDELFFTVEKGASGIAIGRALEEAGIIPDQRLFAVALRLRGHTSRLQAGEYLFDEPLSTIEVLDRLVSGDIYTFSVTVPEGLTLEETAENLARQGLGDARSLEAVFRDPSFVAGFDPGADNLEGYLFPTTYSFTRNPAARDVARAMVNQFEDVFDTERRKKSEELGLTMREVVTFASVIEKETGAAEERPLIGSVFWNRLDRGMPLGSDPTVIYALKLAGTYDGNIRRKDLSIESPYNTYVNAGLPPGPIASPGEAAIDAVLEPDESPYLYFVSKNDGSHHFSRTYREHVNAVRKYQIEYFRNRRRQKGAGPS